MKQSIFTVKSNQHLTDTVLKMVLAGDTSAITASGQFVNIKLDGFFLRRPISVCDYNEKTLTILYKVVGKGTQYLSTLAAGKQLDILAGLGNGYDTSKSGMRPLLIGGGVGIAPLLYFGQEIVRMGAKPTFLLGARSESDLLELEEFRKLGQVLITTEDGSAGEQGFVTNHSVLQHERFDQISTCGPNPMMKAVARVATELGVRCEASLENMMACGVGACLCCVEKTTEGNLCVCKEGPVFDVKRLLW